MKEWLAHEVRALLPVTLFFFVAFHLLVLTQALMLKEYGISATTVAEATIGALIVAKVVIIADHISFLNRFPDKPLIYNILWKTLVYFIASFGVRYVEKLIHAWRHAGSFGEANRQLIENVVWPHFMCVQIWLLVLLLMYCTLRELVNSIGRDRVAAIFLGDPKDLTPKA